MLLNASAVAAAIAILTFHVYQVAACKDPQSARCKATNIQNGGAVGKLQLLAKVAGLVLISVALASSSLPSSALVIGALTLCLTASSYEYLVGCFYGRKDARAVCRANLTELLGFAACAVFLAMLMALALGDKLKASPEPELTLPEF